MPTCGIVNTVGNNAIAVYANINGIIAIDHIEIETSGAQARGARAEAGGELRLNSVSIKTAGTVATGLAATANASGVQAKVTANYVTILITGGISAGVSAFQTDSERHYGEGLSKDHWSQLSGAGFPVNRPD